MSHDHLPGVPANCSDFIESIVYLLDNELDEQEMERVRLHLDECSPCLESYSVQRTMKMVVARSCAETAPDGLRERVLFAMRQVEIRFD